MNHASQGRETGRTGNELVYNIAYMVKECLYFDESHLCHRDLQKSSPGRKDDKSRNTVRWFMTEIRGAISLIASRATYAALLPLETVLLLDGNGSDIRLGLTVLLDNGPFLSTQIGSRWACPHV